MLTTINYTSFYYNGTKVYVLKNESTFTQSIKACKKLQAQLIDLRKDYSKFLTKFNAFFINSTKSVYRVRSFKGNLTEKQCYGLVKYRFTAKNVNKVAYEVCSDNDYFNNSYPSICQSSINENELTTAVITNTLSSEPNQNNISSGTTVGIFAGIIVGFFIFLIGFSIWKNKKSKSTQQGNLQSKETKKKLRLQYKKVRLFFNFYETFCYKNVNVYLSFKLSLWFLNKKRIIERNCFYL